VNSRHEDIVTNTGKVIKSGLRIFERGKNLLQNGTLPFVFILSQSSEIVLQGQNLHKQK